MHYFEYRSIFYFTAVHLLENLHNCDWYDCLLLTTTNFIANIRTIIVHITPKRLQNTEPVGTLEMSRLLHTLTIHLITAIPTIIHHVTFAVHRNTTSIFALEPLPRTRSVSTITGLLIWTIRTMWNSITGQLKGHTTPIRTPEYGTRNWLLISTALISLLVLTCKQTF